MFWFDDNRCESSCPHCCILNVNFYEIIKIEIIQISWNFYRPVIFQVTLILLDKRNCIKNIFLKSGLNTSENPVDCCNFLRLFVYCPQDCRPPRFWWTMETRIWTRHMCWNLRTKWYHREFLLYSQFEYDGTGSKLKIYIIIKFWCNLNSL